MKKNAGLFFISLLVSIAVFVLLSIPLGPAPALGLFFNPNTGFWANAEATDASSENMVINHAALSDSVHVYFDKLGIPHIFAQNDADLYFAQGYMAARDRLWQMEFQTHAAAGRLSEIVGKRALNYDRYQRRIGMGYAAEQAMSAMMKDSLTSAMVSAYSKGVNAWINRLNQSELPLEYKILDYQPERWQPIKTALLFKSMTYTLASRNHDLRMSNTRAFFGDDFITTIIDSKIPWVQPTIPKSKDWPFKPSELSKPDSLFSPSVVDEVLPAQFQSDLSNGSNNWAISGSKTATGYPVLANDPHLNLTLPSIWYAVQLHSPTQNVMGVSLLGAPSVIIGFNEDVAWGTTNVGADVWDWYEMTFRDSTLQSYRYDGTWRDTKLRIEKIKVKNAETVLDTVIYTHYGPVVQSTRQDTLREGIPLNHAVRWIGYEASNEMKYFYEINRASNYQEYQAALKNYGSPAQNWVFADSTNIALTVAGKYPRKWDQQGRYISDGSDSAYEWQGWIPFDQIPSIKNPERGFVSSANQDPVDSDYPYYLGSYFAPFERGRRINDKLSQMDSITVNDVQVLQLDTYSYHAEKVLPTMLDSLNRKQLPEQYGKAIKALSDWNLYNERNLVAPSLFKYWWDELVEAIWNDEYGQAGVPLKYPSRDANAYLIVNKPDLRWYDDTTTEEKEQLSDVVTRSFHAAYDQLSEEYGAYGDSWQWGYVNETKIGHLARIPGLGKQLFTDGGGESVNAIRGSHGPSWRMVVQLGPKVDAYGVFPGGQTGNPGSKNYTQMTEDWNNGMLHPLWFMQQRPQNTDSLAYAIILH